MTADLPTKTVTHKAPDGFILVAALWILSALAALVSIYAIYVSNSAIMLSTNDDAIIAEGLISAGVELSVHRIISAPKDARPARGQITFRMGKAVVTAGFRAETARVDLNYAPRELLAGLLVALGEQPARANQYAERIIGWRTSPQKGLEDSEASLYREAGTGYIPRGAGFAHIAELWLVLGLPPALVERALPHLTVFSGRAEINPAIASPEVAAALPDKRPTHPGTTTEAGESVRVSIHIDFDNGRHRDAEIVVLLRAAGTEPYRVLSWADDLDVQRGRSQRMGSRQ